MQPTILVVEDDRKIATLVSKNLESAGFHPVVVHDGLSALEAFARETPTLVVLDVMLPELDGLEVTRRIRKTSRVPILLLTARTTEGDKVLGLEIGADDYMTKPFGTMELVARVRALLRRVASPEDTPVLAVADLSIDPSRREVVRAGSALALTSLEFDLLYFLAARRGRVFSRDALMNHVWGEDRVVDDRSIDSLVSRLRRKLEPDGSAMRYIQTVWGAGYRFLETPS